LSKEIDLAVAESSGLHVRLRAAFQADAIAHDHVVLRPGAGLEFVLLGDLRQYQRGRNIPRHAHDVEHRNVKVRFAFERETRGVAAVAGDARIVRCDLHAVRVPRSRFFEGDRPLYIAPW
jgi:hypothetical protein